MITVVTGSIGSGKTTKIIDLIADSLRSGRVVYASMEGDFSDFSCEQLRCYCGLTEEDFSARFRPLAASVDLHPLFWFGYPVPGEQADFFIDDLSFFAGCKSHLFIDWLERYFKNDPNQLCPHNFFFSRQDGGRLYVPVRLVDSIFTCVRMPRIRICIAVGTAINKMLGTKIDVSRWYFFSRRVYVGV